MKSPIRKEGAVNPVRMKITRHNNYTDVQDLTSPTIDRWEKITTRVDAYKVMTSEGSSWMIHSRGENAGGNCHGWRLICFFGSGIGVSVKKSDNRVCLT